MRAAVLRLLYPYCIWFDRTRLFLLLTRCSVQMCAACAARTWKSLVRYRREEESFASTSLAVAAINGGISGMCRRMYWAAVSLVAAYTHTHRSNRSVPHARIFRCSRAAMGNVSTQWVSRAFSVSFDVLREEGTGQMYYVNDTRYATLIVVVGLSLILGACTLCAMCARCTRKRYKTAVPVIITHKMCKHRTLCLRVRTPTTNGCMQSRAPPPPFARKR